MGSCSTRSRAATPPEGVGGASSLQPFFGGGHNGPAGKSQVGCPQPESGRPAGEGTGRDPEGRAGQAATNSPDAGTPGVLHPPPGCGSDPPSRPDASGRDRHGGQICSGGDRRPVATRGQAFQRPSALCSRHLTSALDEDLEQPAPEHRCWVVGIVLSVALTACPPRFPRLGTTHNG